MNYKQFVFVLATLTILTAISSATAIECDEREECVLDEPEEEEQKTCECRGSELNSRQCCVEREELNARPCCRDERTQSKPCCPDREELNARDCCPNGEESSNACDCEETNTQNSRTNRVSGQRMSENEGFDVVLTQNQAGNTGDNREPQDSENKGFFAWLSRIF